MMIGLFVYKPILGSNISSMKIPNVTRAKLFPISSVAMNLEGEDVKADNTFANNPPRLLIISICILSAVIKAISSPEKIADSRIVDIKMIHIILIF